MDFTASSQDIATNAPVVNHGYRGGPFLVDAADAAAAAPIIAAWQAANIAAVHRATASFDADIARVLVAAPTIAIFADGNEDIAFAYLNAAGIPDSLGQAWPIVRDNSTIYPGRPDIVSEAEVEGTLGDPADGALLTADGAPAFCHMTSMHYGENGHSSEVVGEVRSFLQTGPVHFFAECQAVNAFENDGPNGFLLSTNGFTAGNRPATAQILQPANPFAQLDGPFQTVGGSEPSFDLDGGMLFATDSLLVQGTGAAAGEQMVFLTGFLDGDPALGKVSYLGGHEYRVDVPISANPDSQGARLFLNGIIEAPCTSADGQPGLLLTKIAPSTTAESELTFTLEYSNAGPGVALDAELTDALPPGTAFVSATDGGTIASGVVTWSLGDLVAGASGSVSLTVQLLSAGPFDNQAELAYRVGNTDKRLDSNVTTTTFGVDSDGDGITDDEEISLALDPQDADSDDDGVRDGDEPLFSEDTDGDGLINALDPDSDDDGIFDGTELGLDCGDPATDPAADTCVADGDAGATTTDPLDRDTDDGGVSDGSEDFDLDGIPRRT